MAPAPQLEPHFLDQIVQASAGYIIPTILLAANLVVYLSQDETRPYELLRLNVTEAIKMPNSLALYHLEDFESEDSALEKRRNVRVCERIITITSHCDGILQISSAIKHASNVKTCSTFTGRAGPNGDLFYCYRETIAGAIEHHIKKHGHKIWGTQCLDLTHGGTWNGYLLIGLASNFDHKAYCGPEVSFKHCDSGGKGDIN
ncbi:uncharacterized protein BKA55DRAFT_597584 [Fusarium redolens]|uniref:Secreted protein CSS2 C-terminal domain-containing protein n=1 Tax=Fusarium redolens TaxID=48865 RepID=A0A9P9JY99_FUSRE|nr:uncharacterized protein BKA55DRAFT_597584 [Fusarium redolens]KAH7237105.1 hypothetical protein BKA55DRAFT_597584 [Fusarium redolens]